jgi:hypothetical protein
MIDRATLLNQNPRGKELLQFFDQMPDRQMSDEELEKFLEMITIYERLYLDEFVRQHPDIPARGVLKLTRFFEEGQGRVAEGHQDVVEAATIPTLLKEFQLRELSTALIMRGTGCSERLIAEFLQRDRGTIHKYLSPITRAIEESLTMDKEERNAVVLPIARDIIQQLEKNTAGVLRPA